MAQVLLWRLLNGLYLVNHHLLVLRKNIIKLKKILIVTYYWPPSGGPGVQRVLKFCKYLNETGWKPIILTVENGDFPVFDQTLEKDVLGYKINKSKSFSFISAHIALIDVLSY